MADRTPTARDLARGPLDPLTYLARVVERDDAGRIKRLEVFYDDDPVVLAEGDQFVTITTQVLLEDLPNPLNPKPEG